MKTLSPAIKLRDGETVKLVIERSRASLVKIWLTEGLLVLALIAAIIGILITSDSENSMVALVPILLLLIAGTIGVGFLRAHLNFKNVMFITNHRIIYDKVENLLSKKTKTVELSKIESKSYKKEGILAHILGFGTLKLSTVSDETTYDFPYCEVPRNKLDIISDLIAESKRRAMVDMKQSFVQAMGQDHSVDSVN